MKQTTALRKIASLKKKIRVVQGGQGAGKTIAILILLINHASSNAGKEIIIASAELTKMRLTVIKDFVKVMKSFGIYTQASFISGTLYRFPNGSFIKFVGLDKDDVGKGFRGDVFYLNEGDKVGFESYREIASRFKNIYIDYNPNSHFWVHDEVVKRVDCDFIKLTFQDNEYLDQGEVDEILYYYKKGYGFDYDPSDPDANTYEPINKYWANKWRVYGLGEIGILEGAVYENWEIIDELPEEAKILGGGIDFGWVHPQACIMAYEWNGRRIYDQISYGSHKGTVIMAKDIIEQELDNEIFYCDNSSPQLISELRDAGINAHPCDGKTGLINFSVDKMSKDTFYVTQRSKDVIEELYSYIWGVDSKGVPTGKPNKIGDDAMNAIQYFEGTEGKYDGSYR